MLKPCPARAIVLDMPLAGDLELVVKACEVIHAQLPTKTQLAIRRAADAGNRQNEMFFPDGVLQYKTVAVSCQADGHRREDTQIHQVLSARQNSLSIARLTLTE